MVITGILIAIAILIAIFINDLMKLIAYFIDNKPRKKTKKKKYHG